MREFKIFLVLVFFTALMYIGVEPIAHSVMHKKAATPDFEFSDLPDIDMSVGDFVAGKELVMQNCTACHSIASQNINAPMGAMDSAKVYGVTPPDLSNVAKLYSDKYLVAFIKNPANASALNHIYDSGKKAHPMPPYSWMAEKQIVDMVAYLDSIKPSTITPREAFVSACSRCHEMKYDNVLGQVDKVASKKYLGSAPPDLSMYQRSRGEEYINSFLNQPQVMLAGTSMPRVGLTEESQEQILSYLVSVSDPKRAERESMGVYFILYFLLMGLLAYLWKRKIWSEVK